MLNQNSRVERSSFYVWLAITYLVIAFVGFGQTYALPAAKGQATFNPAVHVHGWIQLAWLVLFLAQAWMVRSGRTRQHRAFGLLGVSLATLVVVTAIPAAINRAHIVLGAGAPMPVAPQFVGGVVLDELYFAILVSLAIVFVGRPAIHRRLLAIATLVNIGAGFNRLYRLYAPSTADYFFTSHHLEIAILTGDLLMVPMLVHDWVSERRIHPATAMALGALVLLHLVRVPLNASPVSQTVGAFFLRFVGS